jgi:hypothetical protein
MAYENHWLPGFNFNVEEWDAKGQTLRDAGDLPHARHGRYADPADEHYAKLAHS